MVRKGGATVRNWLIEGVKEVINIIHGNDSRSHLLPEISHHYAKRPATAPIFTAEPCM